MRVGEELVGQWWDVSGSGLLVGLLVAWTCCKKKKRGGLGLAKKGKLGKGSREAGAAAAAKAEELEPVAKGEGPAPPTPAEAEKIVAIREGARKDRKDPAYKTLAEIHSDWTESESGEKEKENSPKKAGRGKRGSAEPSQPEHKDTAVPDLDTDKPPALPPDDDKGSDYLPNYY